MGGTYLEHDLGDLDRVRGGAGAAYTGPGESGGAGDGVGYVGLVVGGVQVLAVPATELPGYQHGFLGHIQKRRTYSDTYVG